MASIYPHIIYNIYFADTFGFIIHIYCWNVLQPMMKGYRGVLFLLVSVARGNIVVYKNIKNMYVST